MKVIYFLIAAMIVIPMTYAIDPETTYGNTSMNCTVTAAEEPHVSPPTGEVSRRVVGPYDMRLNCQSRVKRGDLLKFDVIAINHGTEFVDVNITYQICYPCRAANSFMVAIQGGGGEWNDKLDIAIPDDYIVGDHTLKTYLTVPSYPDFDMVEASASFVVYEEKSIIEILEIGNPLRVTAIIAACIVVVLLLYLFFKK